MSKLFSYLKGWLIIFSMLIPLLDNRWPYDSNSVFSSLWKQKKNKPMFHKKEIPQTFWLNAGVYFQNRGYIHVVNYLSWVSNCLEYEVIKSTDGPIKFVMTLVNSHQDNKVGVYN